MMIQFGILCTGLAMALGTLAQDGGEQEKEKAATPAAVREGHYSFFAKPAQAAKESDSKLTWEYLVLGDSLNAGLNLMPLDDAAKAHLKLPKGEGLLVVSLSPHSPAAQAGVCQNDILLGLEEAPLSKVEDMEAQLKAAGDKIVTLRLLHQGQKKTLKVQPRVRVTFGPVPTTTTSYWIGVQVGSLDPALRSHLAVPEDKGLIVTEVVANSAAAKAGIKVNDILLTMADTPLTDQAALVKAVQKNGDKPARLKGIREGNRFEIEVTPAKRSMIDEGIQGVWFNTNPQFDHLNLSVARPGAFLFTNPAAPSTFQDVTTNLQAVNALTTVNPVDKRLEALDAEVKELRKAVEELTRALKDRK